MSNEEKMVEPTVEEVAGLPLTEENLAEIRSRTEEVDYERWVDVRADQVVAVGTYKDSDGVLRSTSDDSLALWHNPGGGCGPTGMKGDYHKGTLPSEIVYDANGAPWCPQCVAMTSQRIAIKQRMEELNNAKILEFAKKDIKRIRKAEKKNRIRKFLLGLTK